MRHHLDPADRALGAASQPSGQPALVLELGQFIPAVYHFNMLADDARMLAFKRAIAADVHPGHVVLELGGGTGVLSYFAALRGARVICVERNPELVRLALRALGQNPVPGQVQVVEADAMDYLPPEPVDVVVCEMLHVGMLREMQLPVIESFKERYLRAFGPPLPKFIPEAYFQAVQPVSHSFDYHGYRAPTALFQDPLVIHRRTRVLGEPVIYHQGHYSAEQNLDCSWDGVLVCDFAGELNALRFITKNVLTVVPNERSTVDWSNQYLVLPLDAPLHAARAQEVAVRFGYRAGDALRVLQDSLVCGPHPIP